MPGSGAQLCASCAADAVKQGGLVCPQPGAGTKSDESTSVLWRVDAMLGSRQPRLPAARVPPSRLSGSAGPRSWLGLFWSLGEHLVAQSAHKHRLPLSFWGWKEKQVSEMLPFPTMG